MIHFLRKIRLGLIAEGRSGKYIKYAVGEIFLVVIGILIALQINGWYQDHLDHKKEIIYLENIAHDLDEQLVTIQKQKDFENSYIEAGYRLLSSYEDRSELIVDSLFAADLSLLASRKTFVRDDPTYTDMVSSGNISLIRNIDLKNNIILLYQNLERTEQIVRNNNSLFTDGEFVPMVMHLGYLKRERIPSQKDLSLDKMESISDATDKRLRGISQRLLQQEANELRLVNSINYRYELGMGHLTMVRELEEQIWEVLEEINREIDANTQE